MSVENAHLARRVRSGPRGSSTPQPRRRMSLATRERLVLTAFLVPAIAYVVIFFAYPLVLNISMSLQDYDFGALATGSGPFVGLQNYITVLSSPVMARAAVNTLVFTVASVAAQFVIGFAIAVYLNRPSIASSVLRRLILIPWVMPLVVTGTMFSLVFATSNGLANEALRALGIIQHNIGWLANGVLALIAITIANIWAGIPFNAVLLYSGLQDVPSEQLEAASVDGANGWQRFWHVTVPTMRPVILIVLMLGVVYTLKVFDIVMVLTGGGPANESHLLSSWAYTQAFSTFQFGLGSAVGNVLLVFALLMGLIYIRLSRGDSKGARR